MITLAIIVYVLGISVLFFVDNNKKVREFKDENEISECLKMSDEQLEEIKRKTRNYSNYLDARESSLVRIAEQIGYNKQGTAFYIWLFAGFSLLLIAGKWFFVKLAYDENNSYVHFFNVFNIVKGNDYRLCLIYSHVCNGLMVISIVGYVLYEMFALLKEKQIGFIIGVSVMLIPFMAEMVLLSYSLSVSYDALYFRTIKEYFGLCNLWQALWVLAEIIVVFISHKFMKKSNEMIDVVKSIKEYYMKEKEKQKDKNP